MAKLVLPVVASVIGAALVAGPAAWAQTPAERDVRRPDGTIVKPIQSEPPAVRSGYDPNSPARIEQENARKVRAEENQRRLEEQIKSREAQLEQARRGREAAADTPIKRQP
jgi:hypothetical protein